MAAGTVERDLAYMLFRSSSTEELRDRLHTQLGEDFFESAKAYKIKLTESQKEIESAYNELFNLLRDSYFDSSEILD